MKITKNFLETLDPRAKIISFFFIVSCMALTPISRIKDFGVYFLLILAISLFSHISPMQILRKIRNALLSIAVFHFLILLILFLRKVFICYFIKEGSPVISIVKGEAWTFLCFIIKLNLSVVLIVIASLTMPYTDFLRGLKKLYIPQTGVLQVLSVLYRIFQLIDKIRRLIRFELYRFVGGKYRKKMRKHKNSLDKLLDKICAFQEKGSSATLMCNNEEALVTAPLRFSYRDFLFIVGIIALLICIISGVIYKIEGIKINNVHLWQNLQI
ncbi:MAG: hypothetical protein E3K37_18280 [Candidatus Kuenenia sp.]|nr:hypothetical protein [Candidatus Kuenenia hertensis]